MATSVDIGEDDRLMALLKQELTSEEQQLFCMSFRAYLKHARGKDFVVDLDDIWQWLGFSTKSNAKKALLKYLTEGTDFNISSELHLPDGSAGTEQGGWNKEKTLMTVEGFKHLCMMAKTEKGRLCRDYFITMEGISQALVHQLAEERIASLERQSLALITDNERVVSERNAVQLALNIQLEEARKKLSRRFDESHKGQRTYIYKDNADPLCNMHNVGQTTNVGEREGSYNTHNFTGRMVYTKCCLDHKVLERLVHHMLDQYRTIRGREWFDASFELVKDVLDTAQLFMDTFVSRCDHMFLSGKSEQIRAILMSAIEATAAPEPNALEEESMDEAVPDESGRVTKPLDFERFLAECCEVGPELSARSGELIACHRLWGRIYTAPFRQAFILFLNSRFKAFRVNDASTKAKLLCYRGLRVLPPPPMEVSCDIDQFVADECRLEYTGLVDRPVFLEAFVQWKRDNGDPDYIGEGAEKSRVYKHMTTRFIKTSKNEFLGVSLQGAALGTGCMNLNDGRRKQVTALDPVTMQVVHTFESASLCAAHFGVASVGNISEGIKYKKLRNNLILTYDPPEADAPLQVGAVAPIDPNDFQRFVREECEVGANFHSLSAELVGCHRIWSKSVDQQTVKALKEFLKKNFKRKVEFDVATKTKLLTYSGLRVKPPPTIEVECDVDQFVLEECRIEYVGRTSNRNLQDAFIAWKRRNGDPDYDKCTEESKRFHLAMSKNFFAANTYTGKRISEHGFYGLSLNNDTLTIGMKLSPKTRKRVLAMDVNTKLVIKTYDSLTSCAAQINANINMLSSQIRAGKSRGNVLYMYEVDTGTTATDASPADNAALPLGVSRVSAKPGSPFKATLRHNKTVHELGTFPTASEASAMYQAAKRAVAAEKSGGPKAVFTKDSLVQSI